MRLRLTKQFNFEMAHALLGYDGACSNIHGHSYKLYVTVEGSPLADSTSPKQGMVVDFGDLKRIVNKHIVEPFDHALVLPEGSPFAVGLATKTVITSFQPTCENLLVHFAELISAAMPKGVKLYSLKLYETDTSSAELIL